MGNERGAELVGVDQYAVFGNPVGHSKSPLIHTAFAEQTGQRLIYSAIEAPIGGFAAAVEAFRHAGGSGCNVTVPFKRDAFELASELDKEAVLSGAVNTLVWNGAGIAGFNTDGKGLLRDLQQNLGIELQGRRVLLVGAGGAAAGVLRPLLTAAPAQLVVCNRSPARAQQLVERFSRETAVPLMAAPMDQPGGDYDLVINATSASLSDQVPSLPAGLFGDQGVAYDLAYADQPTAFLRWATGHGAQHCHDGWGMLVEQAAEAFLIWRGVRPETAPVIALR